MRCPEAPVCCASSTACPQPLCISMLPVSWKLTSAGGFVPGSYFPLTSGGFGPRQLLAADLKGAEFLPGSHQEPLDRLLGLGSEVAVGSQ